ncbi:response regulator [Sphingomonas aestuarii]
MRLLIVEDNVRISGLTARGLQPFGFSCDCVATLADADHAIELYAYDALVLDLGMPDGDGAAWLVDRRRNRLYTPVIMLTARSALGDRVTGLDAGADDYLVKPFAIEELAARLRALLRRPGSRTDPVIAIGPLRFDAATRSATYETAPLHLTQREAALLELMMTRAGSVVTRTQIESSIYTFNEPVTSNALEALVSRLRRKLAVHGVGEMLITLRGVGYLMMEDRR